MPPGSSGKWLLSAGLFLLVALAFQGGMDSAGRSYTEQGFKRALVTYGIARGLNGVISVAQGTEVSLHPAGMGVTLTPGQILDPVNDLIERFSWIMLASSSSLGMQRMLIDIASWPGFSLLLGSLSIVVVIVESVQNSMSAVITEQDAHPISPRNGLPVARGSGSSSAPDGSNVRRPSVYRHRVV